MFYQKTRISTEEQKVTARTDNTALEPLVILDVDETLILGRNERGDAIDTFNHELIDALVKANIKEVYLLTSFTLNLVADPIRRKEIELISRLQLIRHLEDKGITVKALISNYDLISSPQNESHSFLPGHYYATVIRPQEQLILSNPEINLADSGQCDYPTLYAAQENYAGAVKKITSQYAAPHNNVKAPLADNFFTWLEQNGILSAGNPRTVLFFDDRQHYLDAVSAMAEKHHIRIDCLKVIKGQRTNDYLHFLSGHYAPDRTEYPAVMAEVKDGLIEYKEHPFIAEPLNKILDVVRRIQDDMKKNPHHEWIGACKALTREIDKQAELLKNKQATFSKNEQPIVAAFLKDLTDFSAKTGKIFTTLAAHYHVDFQVESRVDINAREAKSVPAQTLEGEIQAVTQLPNPLVAIVSDYVSQPPTPFIINLVKDLSGFQRNPDLLNQYDWKGVSVTIDRRGTFNLHHLKMDGIIFKDQQENTIAGTRPKSEEEASTILEHWYERYQLYCRCRPSNDLHMYINFEGASLTGAKFENLLCASFYFKSARLTDASFKSSILTRANFSWATMQKVDLSSCYGATYLYGQEIVSPDFRLTDLTQAKLCKSNFSRVTFHSTILNEAKLNEGIFDSAIFSGCSMRHADLTNANFTNAQFCPFETTQMHSVPTNLAGANATEANFTSVRFNNTNLQNIILTGANLTGAHIKEAHLQGAQLQGAHFTLDQFTEEQILSFNYTDENARFYIKAIFDYMNGKEEAKHKKGFERARQLILSFIIVHPYENGQNKLLTGFLLTGTLPGEGTFSSLFASSESNENSLRAQLQKVKDNLDALANAPSVTYHALGKGSD